MILCNDLHKQFGDVEAVKGVSMEIPDGMFLGLLGPNGAGKTTLMRIMTGLLAPDTGTVAFDGQVMDRNAVAVKQAIGVTSQHVNLDKELTVEENMEFAGRLYRMGKADIAASTDRLLAFLGLDSVRKRAAQNLSGGMKRKLMIAKSLIHNPKYLFLDEPTVGIDPNARRDIWDFLHIQHKEGKTILLTTHYIEEAQHLCDYVMLIDGGKIFKEDTPAGLIDEIGQFKVEYEDGDRIKAEFLRTCLLQSPGLPELTRCAACSLPRWRTYFSITPARGWEDGNNHDFVAGMAVPQTEVLESYIFTDGIAAFVFYYLWDGTGECDGDGWKTLSLLSDTGPLSHDHHAKQLHIGFHPHQRHAPP